MSKFKQTEEKYKHLYMGFGSGTIYSFGCYLVSLVNGLNERGYDFTPEGFNDFLKQNHAWTGEFSNYINVEKLDDILPNIFTSYEKIEPWDDKPPLSEILKPELIVVCKVNAKPIGGSGSHFVLLTGRDKNTAIIHDPWTGKEEKITNRWGDYGNILSLRIFQVKPFTAPEEQGDIEKNAFQYLASEFKNLPESDELKKGNLEGYARSITEEHKKFAELDTKAKILDGFISKWQSTLNIKTEPEDTFTQILHKIEEEISILMGKEDILEDYQGNINEYLGIFLTKDTLELISGDDKKVLEAFNETKAKISKLKEDLEKCEDKLKIAKIKDILYEIIVKGYIIRILKKKQNVG